MRNENDGTAVCLQLVQDGNQFLRFLRRQNGGGFVENEDFYVPIQGLDDFHALFLPNGKLIYLGVQVHLQAIPVHDLFNLCSGGLLPDKDTIMAGIAQHDVAQYGQGRNEHEVLVNHANAVLHGVLRGVNGESFSVDLNFAFIRLEDAIEHVHQRGLSSAIFADQAMDLAGFHREIYAIYRLNAGKGLVDVGHFDCVLIHIRDLLQMKVRFDIRFKSKVRPPRPRCESAAGEMGGRWRANGLYATTGGNSASLIY